MAPNIPQIPPSRVEVIGDSLRDRGFSAAVASCIAKPQKSSTIAVYESKWKKFVGWCGTKQVDSLHPSVPIVAEFLLSLYQIDHLKPSTIDGYRSAIASTIRAIGGPDLGHDPQLTGLINNLYKQNPVTRPQPPGWDLSFVLNALRAPPFEPIDIVPLKFVTFKTIFLLAFATARRRGELHALLETGLEHAPFWTSVTIYTDPTFVPKTKVQPGLPPLTIPALSGIRGPITEADSLLCPVRAIRTYLQVTAGRRQGRRRLFIAHKTAFMKDIAPSTISTWLRETIMLCYKSAPRPLTTEYKITGHQVRGMATSWAFAKRASMADIMAAATWKSRNTFTNFYLRDVTNITKDMLKLGPLVVSQLIL
jgi:hypothetical protein